MIPARLPVTLSLVEVCAAMVLEASIVGEIALILIEVSGTKSFFRVGVPSQPQPDTSNSNCNISPDLIKVTIRALYEKK
jgi:hypothetical protein